MNGKILQTMKQMKLYGMALAFKTSLEDQRIAHLTADEMIAFLIDAEWDDRNNRRTERRIHNARFRYKANVEQIDFEVDRNLDSSCRAVLMEIMEDRHGKHSTIITSQLPVRQWHDVIGEKTIADAVLDRIVHNAHRIELAGESLRKQQLSWN